jgi:Penicillin binding protein transpeptidase domain
VDATRLLRDASARGAVLALDVGTGAVVARGSIDRDLSAPVLPLSVVKLYIAALWWDQQLGDGDFPHPRRPVRVTVHDTLVDGYDHPGELIAIELRRRMTGERVLAALRRYGLGPTLTLAANADDATWGSVLSLGEHSVRVTLDSVSSFLRAIGRSELVQSETARRLHAAMRDTVARGTAKSAAPRVPAGWHLGGKTGTGPGALGKPYDGWFAGLIFEGHRPRYTIAVYVDRGGPGGGIAASIAANAARALAATPSAAAADSSPAP